MLKAAIRDGDLAAAENNLTAEWGVESLYGGRVRLFRPESLQAMLKDGNRSQQSRSEEYDASPTTCRHRFLAALNMSGFSTWSASWAAVQSLPQSPATRSS